MDLRLLGPLEVSLEDGPIELGPRKQRAVLAMLALEEGKTVSADRLSEGLWGDRPPSSAPKMVQLYVSHLRRLLGENGARIVTRGRGYELQLADGGVDVGRAERLLEESRPREALALWRGEPLADLADEPFAGAEIRRLEDLRLRATEMAGDADLAAGRHAELTGELDRLVAEHPLRERLHGQRMLALYRAGRQSEALEAYRQARSALVEQIGVEPGAELRRLHDRILAQDPALDLAATAAVAPATQPQAGQSSRPRRPRSVLVGAAVLLFAGITAFGVIRVLEPDSLPGIKEDAVGVLDPDGGRITAQYGVGRGPGAMTTDGRGVWVANQRDGTVSRMERGRDEVVTIGTGGAPTALAFGAGSLWVADGEGRQVAQVDPIANKVVQRIDAANAPRSLALAEDALWVVSGVDGSVHRIELDRPQAARAVRLGVRATAIAAGAGALWVASEEAGTITRVDPRSGAVVASIPVGNAPSALEVGDGAVWVVSRSEGTLSRVDPGTNAMSGTVRVGTDLTGVTVGEGAVWVAGGEEGIVARVDSGDLRVVTKRKTGSSPSAVAVAGGSVWVAAVPPEAAHRGGTLRVDLPSTIDVAANSLDGYSPESGLVTSLAYDGLLAYRRVGGPASATLVGALATRPPAPSPDGRTYVFTLRSGLRYSDGKPVAPHDFRASMERYLSATRDSFPPLFAGIVGARRCISGRGECDLSRGIESDQRTRTITVHLTARDPDFLHKLTLPFAYVVPADTPASRRADLAPPGTGPYRIASWHAPRGGVLVRNARFRPTAARSAGFADRIEIRRSTPGRVEANVAAVQRGSADVTWVSSPFQEVRSRERLAALVARAPGRLYSSASAGKVWMFLNTLRPPFDDVRVRRAVNFATDRAELVERVGGPEVAAPACQTIPAAFPGFSPYCPYTVGRARGGWIAPDLARARRLIAESGTAGATVVVEVPEWHRPVGAYFVSLLRDLGFRARLHVVGVDEYFEGIFSPDSRAQMGWAGWVADYISASTFVEPLFGCPTRADRHPENTSRLCSESVMTAIRRAQSSAPDDAAAAWAVADRRIVDLAAAVPYVDGRTAVFVSKRVGNVTHHPQFTTLLDRMWVR